MSHLENNEVVLIQCNIVNNEYQQDSTVLYTFVPNKSFRQFLDIMLKTFYILKNIWFRVFIYWSMAYCSKLQTSRDRTF